MVSVLIVGNQTAKSGAKVGAKAGAPGGQGRRTDCVPALKELGDRFRARGDDVTELMDVAGPLLRAGIGQFAAALPPAGRAVVAFCGDAMSGEDKLFLLPSGISPSDPADLPREALIARTVSRVLSGHDSIFVAELSTPAGRTPPTAASIQSLREETATRTALSIGMAPGDGGAPLIERFAGEVAKADDWSALSALVAASTTAAPQPAPDETPSHSAAPPAPVAAVPTPPEVKTPDQTPPETRPADAPAKDATAQDPMSTSAGTPLATPGTGPSDTGTPSSTLPDVKTAETVSPADTPRPSADTPDADPAASADTRPVTRRPRPDLVDPNSGSPIVRRAQVALLARGLLKGRVNGMADADTQSAVKAYQSSLGHTPTGFLTYQEIATLEHTGK